MFSIFKKLVVVAGVLLVGGWLWAKSDLGSYAKTAWNQLRGSVKSQVPIDFEIKRAQDMLSSLDQETDKIIKAMANQMRAIQKEEQGIGRQQAWLEKEEKLIKTMNAELKSNRPVLVSSLGETPRDRYALDLERRFSRFKLQQDALKSQKDALVVHKETLEGWKDQLEGMRAVRSDLHARIEKLGAELQIVRAAETRTTTPSPFDDSQLAKVKELIDNIEEAIRTRKFEAQLREEQRPTVVTPVVHSSPDLTAQIDVHFDTAAKDDKATAQK